MRRTFCYTRKKEYIGLLHDFLYFVMTDCTMPNTLFCNM